MNEIFILRKKEIEQEVYKDPIDMMRFSLGMLMEGKHMNYLSQEEKAEIIQIYEKEIQDRLAREIPVFFEGTYHAGKWKRCRITVLESFVHSYTGQEKYCSRMEYPDGYVDYKVLNKEEIVDYLVFGERFGKETTK